MFSTMHHPVYRDEGLPPLFTASSPYRPTVSSPLSSSPVRASTPPPHPSSCSSTPLSPLSPCQSFNNGNLAPSRDVQSSPIPAPPSKAMSRFASRGAPRPNPLTTQKREAAQESRRKLFLKNVRQRAEDKRWEKRGGEQEVSKPAHNRATQIVKSRRGADETPIASQARVVLPQQGYPAGPQRRPRRRRLRVRHRGRRAPP